MCLALQVSCSLFPGGALNDLSDPSKELALLPLLMLKSLSDPEFY